MDYVMYVVDTETTGLDPSLNDVIELSLCRISDNAQKIWRLKPSNIQNIEAGALRVNGHKLEDLKHETKYGRDTYSNPTDVLIEVENWVMEDGMPAENRILCGQNTYFDKSMLEKLWEKCNSKDTFPFGRRILDTMQIALFTDYVDGNLSSSYSLSALIKKYGIKNEKAHSAEADVKATKELLEKQISGMRQRLGIKL